MSGASLNGEMKTIVLATASSMPKPDPESHLLVTALERCGARARLLAWDAEFDWSSADVVVVRSTWDYFERLDEFLSWADAVGSVSRLVNAAAVLRWNTHKRYLTELIDRGVPTVPTALVERGSTLADLWALLPGSLELVVKPAVSIGAFGAMRASASDVGLAAHLAHLALSGDVLVQPFVPSVVDRGKRLWCSLVSISATRSARCRAQATIGSRITTAEPFIGTRPLPARSQLLVLHWRWRLVAAPTLVSTSSTRLTARSSWNSNSSNRRSSWTKILQRHADSLKPSSPRCDPTARHIPVNLES